MQPILTLENSDIQFDQETCKSSTTSLEAGAVLYLPNMPFPLAEADKILLSPDHVKGGIKNISYLPDQKIIRGMEADSAHQQQMADMLQRYVDYAVQLVDSLLPAYKGKYRMGKTSFRPVEIQGRESSYRKDDTRLHVDAFPSNPNQGLRLLRVFCNVNPNSQARHWRLGESFRDVAKRFVPIIPRPFPGKHKILKAFGVTKSMRTDYDHYMLQMHNRMKADMTYQREVNQAEFHFPPQTTWIVFTDSVSHAAMSGQYLLEQTFYLPVEAMKDPEQAPLRILEGMLGRKLA